MKNLRTLAVAALLAFIATACNKSDAADEPSASESIERVLAGYEQARTLLVADTLDGLAAAAGQIQQAAEQAASGSEGARATHLSELATNAGALARTAGGDDIEEARRAFGDVSRPLVALLSADESLRAGRHLFSCPMAQDYEKWVQPDDTIENPYMGQRMLACGGPAKWE